MSLLLHIESATTQCSVALSQNGELLAAKQIDNGYTHAENLHVFIQDLFTETGFKAQDLKAVAVSRGPGSYTGLRIGVSAAKGLAYALHIPLIAIDTLSLMALQAKETGFTNGSLCAMLDARRMEVYCAVYDQHLQTIGATEALVLNEESVEQFSAYGPTAFFGNGMPKCRDLLSRLPGSVFIEHIQPSAAHMCQLAYEKYTRQAFEDTAYFEPFYLKDFLILKKAGAP